MLVPLGDVRLYRPSRSVEHAFDEQLRAHFRDAGRAPGVYGGAAANAIAQEAYEFSSRVFETELKTLASRDAAQFVLDQLGEWTEAALG